MTNKNYFSGYLQDKTAAVGSSNAPASRMSILRGKIDRYRDKQKEDAKKKEKDDAARLKEIQKQQEQMQQPQSVADKMRENFNQFAGTNFAGSNPTALPTVSAPTPVGNQQKQAAFYKKVACLINDIEVLQKFAETNDVKKKSMAEIIANNPSVHPGVRKGMQEYVIQNDPTIPKTEGWMKLINDFGPFILQATGLNRDDDRQNLDINTVNVHRSEAHRLGDVSSYVNGLRAVRGFTTPYTPSWS